MTDETTTPPEDARRGHIAPIDIEDELKRSREGVKATAKKPSDGEVRKILATMDSRGAWVEEGHLKFHKVDTTIIDSQTFIENVDVLSRYLAK